MVVETTGGGTLAVETGKTCLLAVVAEGGGACTSALVATVAGTSGAALFSDAVALGIAFVRTSGLGASVRATTNATRPIPSKSPVTAVIPTIHRGTFDGDWTIVGALAEIVSCPNATALCVTDSLGPEKLGGAIDENAARGKSLGLMNEVNACMTSCTDW